MKSIYLTTCVGIFGAAISMVAHANSGKIQGYSVDICKPAEIEGKDNVKEDLNRDFCNHQAAATYKKFGTKDINFANKYVLAKIYNTSFVAIDPVKKQVFVMPYAIQNSLNDNKAGKIVFNKNSNRVCTQGDDTSLSPYSWMYVGGDSAHPDYKLCIDFYPSEGFSDQFIPVHIKTGKVASRL